MQIVTVVQVYVLYTVLCTLFGNSVQKDVAMTLKVRSCRPESFWGSDFCSIYIFFLLVEPVGFKEVSNSPDMDIWNGYLKLLSYCIRPLFSS